MLKSTLLILATSYFAWYMERFEIAMIYPFDTTYATPAAAGEARMVETRFLTGDGESLIVWRAAAQSGKPTLMYFPGNAGGLKDRADRFARLLDRGYGVTAMAYRGSSGSTGRPEELLLTEDAEALAASETGRPLILYGESLGTAVAVKLAAEGFGDAIVLEAPFTSILDLVKSQYPDETIDHLITQRWDSLSDIPHVRQPMMIIHGAKDRIVPIRMGRRILEFAGSDEKSIVEIADRGHRSIWTAEARRALFQFIDSR